MPWQKTTADRQRDSQRYGAAWRRARERCLREARWRCEIKIPGVCIHAASEVDHIVGVENDPHHKQLRAACKPCHAKVTAEQGGGYRVNRGGGDPECQPRTAW